MQRPTALAQMLLPRNLLVWLTVQVLFNQMDMLICPSKSQSAAVLRRQPKWLHQPKQLRWCPVSLLHLGISPFCGQQRSVWKCGFDLPSAHSLRAAILSCSYHAILNPPLSFLSIWLMVYFVDLFEKPALGFITFLKGFFVSLCLSVLL